MNKSVEFIPFEEKREKKMEEKWTVSDTNGINMKWFNIYVI